MATFISPHSFLTYFTSGGFHSCSCAINRGKDGKSVSLKLNLARGYGEEKTRGSWWSCWCKKGTEEDADFSLENQKFEFMKICETPEVNPSKKEVDSNSFAANSSSSPSSVGRAIEVAATDVCGMQGLLSLLERDRNIHFGFGFREKDDNNACSGSSDSEKESLVQASMDMKTFAGPGRRNHVSSNHNIGLENRKGVKHSQNASLSGTDGLTWREWSLQRAQFAEKGFKGEMLEIRNVSKEKEMDASESEIGYNELKCRIHYHKLELSSLLQSLRSIVVDSLSQKDDGRSVDNLQFQGNEMRNAQEQLRFIRSRLEVFEGKMALALIDAQQKVKEKQKRIEDAQRALQLLRTAYIVWTSSASKVLLTGSFDGWTTKRKMERSSYGVFSVCLKLYPGKYEIKFIVDGEWKIDPLRPTVNNNGFKNNLLIIQ